MQGDAAGVDVRELYVGEDEVVDGGFGKQAVHEGLDLCGAGGV